MPPPRYPYAEESREELGYRVHELEDDLEAISGELLEAQARLRKAEDLAYRAYCMAAVGREELNPAQEVKGGKRAKAKQAA